MSIILLSKADQEYLQKCATQLNFTYGIIIGQKAEPEKYVIVHLAKNGEEDVDLPAGTDDNSLSHGPQRVHEIDLQALTNQWLSAGRMIPGSFNVLGVFVAAISREFVDDLSEEFKSAKRLLYDVHNLLKQSHQLAYREEPQTEYLYVSYSSEVKKAVCKIYSYVANGGTFSSMDHRFVEKPFEWHGFECNYELDDVFPIVENTEKINIEAQFQHTIELLQNYINSSEIFIQNDIVEDNQMLDEFVKRKRQQNGKTALAHAHCPAEDFYKASILLPVKCLLSKCQNPVQVREFQGTVRFQGTVTSRIWCNPKNRMADVKRFLCTDILRSLMARIQVYCDGLTDPSVNYESMFVSEPPRRVYFNVNTGSGSGPVQFSEYIFRGEAPTVAVAQAKQILDLDITTEQIIADLEGLPDDDAFIEDGSQMLETSKQRTLKLAEKSATRLELARSMYMLGIAVALLVLVISVAIHFLFH